jgi:hypothetical protein
MATIQSIHPRDAAIVSCPLRASPRLTERVHLDVSTCAHRLNVIESEVTRLGAFAISRQRTGATQHDVCYHHSEQHGHRMWNRDVMAAINFGCLFLARAMGREVGLWERGTSAG